MNKYEVCATVWSEEVGEQIKKVIGTFDDYTNASLFKKTYEKRYSTSAEIIEYVRK